MGGRYITQSEVELYMKYRNKGLTQEVAAKKLAISVRSGRTIEKGQHHTSRPPKRRAYKTRTSPIDEVWKNELEPMLHQKPDLQPKTLFLHLQKTCRDKTGKPLYGPSIERTLQRRVAHWKALHGPDKAVTFSQVHYPAVQGLSDFTTLTAVVISIRGVPFNHIFYHFRLVYSKWSYLKVIQGGESLQALSEGLQEALYKLEGAPLYHRTDSLSAAFKNGSKDAQDDLTTGYKALCQHYNMTPTRNNRGKANENGSVESSHGHIKHRMTQELLLRGSTDFDSIAAYEAWVQRIVDDNNARLSHRFREEKALLQSLPRHKTVDYEVRSVKITHQSMMTIRGMRYSLPSRLSGYTLTVHIYQQRLEVYLGSHYILQLTRCYEKQHGSRYVIDYRHVIGSLIKKPGAFRQCCYRDELLPSETYRTIWQHIDTTETHAVAPKLMLRLLKLAADHRCEVALGEHVMELIREKRTLKIELIESLFNQTNPALPDTPCKQHALSDYDHCLLSDTLGGDHATV